MDKYLLSFLIEFFGLIIACIIAFFVGYSGYDAIIKYIDRNDIDDDEFRG